MLEHCSKAKVKVVHMADSVVQLCSQIPCFRSAHFSVVPSVELVTKSLQQFLAPSKEATSRGK